MLEATPKIDGEFTVIGFMRDRDDTPWICVYLSTANWRNGECHYMVCQYQYDDGACSDHEYFELQDDAYEYLHHMTQRSIEHGMVEFSTVFLDDCATRFGDTT